MTGRYDAKRFSLDCSGVVNRVGTAVTQFREGDRVWGFAPGNFGNYTRAPASFLQKMSSRDSFSTMASLPISYLTALYALMHLAHLNKGESVLIQSAAGGLGMAALHVAQYLEADIYVTAGTQKKAEFLTENYKIDPGRIFSSRGPSASSEIMRATQNRGIDVILCSAAGEQMHEAWRCIAPLGRFIEVGRTDVHGHANLSMDVFRRNATFSSFDIELLFSQKPELGAR